MEIEIDEKLHEQLSKEGYTNIRYVEGRGLCGLFRFAFTMGLCYGLEKYGYEGRYCYPHQFTSDAVLGLALWDGKGDPIGQWIKHKGGIGEYTNPNFD